jgi:hypothetical protein
MKTLSFEHFSANSTPKIEITSPCSQSTSFLVTSFVGKHSLNSSCSLRSSEIYR